MKTSLKKNYIYNLLYQILIIILPIITTPYIARTLGAEGNGIYSYTISITSYFILFGTLGINLYGQREIAYVQNKEKERSKIFFELLILRIMTMIVSIVVFYFLCVRKGEYHSYYAILTLELLANCIDISWFYQGLENFKKIVIRNFVIKIISLILIFTLIKDKNDVILYILIYSLSTFIGSVSLWLGIKKYLTKPSKINIRKHLKPIMLLFIPQIAVQVYVVLDKTMIGLLTNSMTEVGYYEQAHKIIKILLTLVTSLSTVMMPRIAQNYAEKNYEKIKYYMNKTFKFIYMMSLPLTFGVIATAHNFVPIFFGQGYDKVPSIMIILSFIIIFISISGTIGTQFLLSTKRQKEFTTSVITGAIVNFVLNIVLICKLQSIGAAIATLIAEFTVTLIQFIYVRKDLNIKENILSSKNYLISSIIMLLICLVIDYVIISNFIGILFQISLGAISYFVMLLLLKDSFLTEILNPILNKIKSKNNIKN